MQNNIHPMILLSSSLKLWLCMSWMNLSQLLKVRSIPILNTLLQKPPSASKISKRYIKLWEGTRCDYLFGILSAKLMKSFIVYLPFRKLQLTTIFWWRCAVYWFVIRMDHPKKYERWWWRKKIVMTHTKWSTRSLLRKSALKTWTKYSSYSVSWFRDSKASLTLLIVSHRTY